MQDEIRIFAERAVEFLLLRYVQLRTTRFSHQLSNFGHVRLRARRVEQCRVPD